jgi:hypothetical protein
MFYQKFYVRPFRDQLWQCYNCQRFGHSAKFCDSKPRCVVCSEEHKFQDCPVKNTKDKMKCANCKGNHTSSYSGCREVKTAKQVQEIKNEHNISYREALTRAKSQQTPQQMPNNPSRQTETNQASNIPIANPYLRTRPQQAQPKSLQKPIMVDAECQTSADQSTMTDTPPDLFRPANKNSSNQEEAQPMATIQSVLTSKDKEKELAFLIHILSSIVQNENINKKILDITQAYDKQYNVKIDNKKVQASYQSLTSKLNKQGGHSSQSGRSSSRSTSKDDSKRQ